MGNVLWTEDYLSTNKGYIKGCFDILLQIANQSGDKLLIEQIGIAINATEIAHRLALLNILKTTKDSGDRDGTEGD